jgi:hypothetical protein
VRMWIGAICQCTSMHYTSPPRTIWLAHAALRASANAALCTAPGWIMTVT